jgi:hypothetical protein
MSASGDFLTFGGKSEAANFATPHSCHHTSLSSTSPQTTPLFFAVCLLSLVQCISPPFTRIASVAVPSLSMAELPGNGKQPPERHKPSRLRHEIRLDSPDDERESKEHVVQEPNSDTVVPETQLDYNGHYNDFNRGFDAHSDYGDDIPLSPNSLAVLKRTAVTKKPEALEPTPFTIKLLSKAGLNDNSASSVTPAFSFGQAKKASSKTPPKEGVAASQSTAHASLKLPLMQQLDEHVPNSNTLLEFLVHNL